MSAEAIAKDLLAAPTEEAFNSVVRAAYSAGWTLQQIGDVLGVSREAVRLRIKRSERAGEIVSHVYAGPKVRNYMQKASRRKPSEKHAKKKRILGLRLSSPVMSVPVETLNEIAALREKVTKVRGTTPLDHPNRLAVKPYGDLLYATIEKYGIPNTHLESVMGLSRSAFRMWLGSHGYIDRWPSQKPYRGVYRRPTGANSRLEVGGKCRNGHDLAEGDIARNGTTGNQTCKLCRRDRYMRSKGKRHEEV